jgi:hypothetical protein
MSVGPMGGVVVSAAGSPLAQTKGADVERAEQETAGQQRQVQGQFRAESAAGIGQADGEDHEASERDADGRRLWEASPRTKNSSVPAEPAPHPVKDATGESGNQLDLTG